MLLLKINNTKSYMRSPAAPSDLTVSDVERTT